MSVLTQDDLDYVISLAANSLAKTVEKDSWVENSGAGELPAYVREVATSVRKTGKTTSQAIAIAISRIKKWAATGEGDTKAKAAKALAEWEKLKASSKGKKVAKLSAQTGLMEMCARPVEIIALSGVSYNIDKVRSAYDHMIRDARKAARAADPYCDTYDSWSWAYVQEVWNTHLIVRNDGGNDKLYKVDYTVDDSGNPSFAKPVEVVVEYVEAGKDISDSELEPALG